MNKIEYPVKIVAGHEFEPDACINELVIRARNTTKKNAQYAYIAPNRRQAWKHLKDATEGIAIDVGSDLSVTLPTGARISVYSSDNPDALRGLHFDGVIVSELLAEYKGDEPTS